MARHLRKIGHASNEDLRPSQVTDVFWLSARREEGEYPKHSQLGGKWLIFVPMDQVDAVWETIKQATRVGMLGGSAKVATAKPNPNASNSDEKVICVYTYDWTDQEDVRRIRENLRQLGITRKIPYKADKETETGSYANRGQKRISKFYE
jgi:hypothetical protein